MRHAHRFWSFRLCSNLVKISGDVAFLRKVLKTFPFSLSLFFFLPNDFTVSGNVEFMTVILLVPTNVNIQKIIVYFLIVILPKKMKCVEHVQRRIYNHPNAIINSVGYCEF